MTNTRLGMLKYLPYVAEMTPHQRQL